MEENRNEKEISGDLNNKKDGDKKDEIVENFLSEEEQEKLFNTNQKNFYKFRKDIKEEPDLEEDTE